MYSSRCMKDHSRNPQNWGIHIDSKDFSQFDFQKWKFPSSIKIYCCPITFGTFQAIQSIVSTISKWIFEFLLSLYYPEHSNWRKLFEWNRQINFNIVRHQFFEAWYILQRSVDWCWTQEHFTNFRKKIASF